MLDLCFTTDDEQLIQLAIEYWQLGDNGDWTHGSTISIAKRHGYTQAKLTKIVHDSYIAFTTVRCSCGRRLTASSRTTFNALQSLATSRKRVGPQGQCDVCVEESLKEQLRLQEERRSTEEKKIQQQIQAWLEQLTPKSYAGAPFHDAYLLYGLLSASGDLWTQGSLQAWYKHKTLLFAHAEDTAAVYRRLHERGWIAPNPVSRWELRLDDDGTVSYDPRLINWTLATDSDGMSFTQTLLSLEYALEQAILSDWREAWYSVCLSELRKLLEKELDRFGFSCKRWSPLIEQNLRQLLDECSLAETMRIVYDSVSQLVKAREDKHKNYNRQHLENMLPGSFRRRLDYIRSNGWTLYRWHRYGTKDEAIFTSLLFDRILKGGNHFYETLTGAAFEP